ncbi:protein kinase [Streptomyces sp. NPDC056656]|uniref:protein kinase domain-containing protein n=1 Tax=Streptomyces sp. NPDC056656 TaxID=3345895 RepID=UPI0036A46678
MSSGDQEEAGSGRLLAGRYRVRGQLGRGGMGVVWRAVDEVLGREVALKELRTYSDAAGSELADLGVRMQREARAAARVRHPGVVAVHDVTEVDGRPLIVMELIDGPSLDDVLRDQGPLDPREAAAIGAKVMDALEAAHRAGVLHRDVKPGNILLDRSGRVVLTDFGIATMDDPGDGSATHLTRSGELVGSLDYLAPERAQGQDPGPASDVWALGATLYAAVEGASPFRRTSTWSTLTAIVVEPLPEPRRAGHHLTPVLQQLMAKDPLARPDADRARQLLEAVAATPADVATAALRQPGPRPRETTVRNVPSLPPPGFGPAPTSANAQAPTPVNAPPPTPVNASPPDEPRKPGRTRVLLAVAAVIAVLGAAGATVAALNGSDDKGDRAASSGAATTGTPEADHSRGTRDGTGKPSGQGHEKSREPDGGKVSEKPGPKPSASRPVPSASSPAEPRPTKSGITGGGGGGASPAPAPVCHSAGGGKYNCTVWRTSDSYTASGARAGVLNAGTNYFYCQQNLGRRETYGKWTNVWWAKTDDDSGNTNVFVSDVYVKGGDNNAPLPGLPVC